MKYVHTTGHVIEGYEKSLLDPYVDYYLYSLYNGFSESPTFGYNNVDRIASIFNYFHNILDPHQQLMADSGGYSIIVGQVKSRDVAKFIGCYNYFLEKYNNTFDQIFSLDIPIFLKEPTQNNCTNIHKYNLRSCIETKQILDQNPHLYEKFVFVWHFKLEKQYNIWRSIFDQTYANEPRLKHFALGGMVSLKGTCNLKFAPFVVPSYKLLKLIMDKNYEETSIIHILGQYGLPERFMMIFLEKLFNDIYLKDLKAIIEIRYDTIYYSLMGLYAARDIKLLQLYPNKDRSKLIDCIPDEQTRQIVLNELQNVDDGKDLENPRLMALTQVVYSNLIDKTFEQVIDQYDLVNFVASNPNFYSIKNQLYPLFVQLGQQYPHAFKNIEGQLLENLKWVCSMHSAWVNGMSDDMDRIDNAVIKFGKAINFPFDLGGEFAYEKNDI